MNKKLLFIQRNLSAFSFVIIYIILVAIHLFSDSFILANQIGLIITFLPFVAIGGVLDFILRRNTTLDKGFKIFAQLLPAGVFALQAVTAILDAFGRTSYDIFRYAIWLFLTAPFFIAGYQKNSHSKKMLYSLIGTGVIVVVYLFLTTKTIELNKGAGALIDFISYFCMLYAASGIRKFPYLGFLLGLLNAGFMLSLYYSPVTLAAQTQGWDYDFNSNMEFMIVITLFVSIMVSLFSNLQKEEATALQ
jgi:hypothetical protein